MSLACKLREHGFLIGIVVTKKKAVLVIKIKEIPLAPALALTAHAAQGQTKQAVIADLVIGRRASRISSYVALTRIRHCEGLMI